MRAAACVLLTMTRVTPAGSRSVARAAPVIRSRTAAKLAAMISDSEGGAASGSDMGWKLPWLAGHGKTGSRTTSIPIAMVLAHAVLKQAVDLHRAGRLDEAAVGYQRVLAEEPENPDALHFLGLVAYQSGRAREAVDLIRR